VSEVRERIGNYADRLAAEADRAEQIGQLTDETARLLREIGVIRLLQPRAFGGYECQPNEFFTAVMQVCVQSGSAGWVAGVVGVHPWELGQIDEKAQAEIWGSDPDTWVASPYAPFGRAKPIDGGFLFSGRWPFSTGVDHAKWVILGGVLTDPDGNAGSPPQIRHLLLPKDDCEVVGDSWEVMGLKGSGSKDVMVHDAFVPHYRVVDPARFVDGEAARSAGRDNPLYALPFGVMFPAAIIAATLGIAEGALTAFVDYTRDRISIYGERVASDPFQLTAFSLAAADIEASRVHFLDDMSRLYDIVAGGGALTIEQRIASRRNHVAASARAVQAVDRLFAHAGGGAIRLDNPLQRYWRDLHAAMNHLCNVAEPVYLAFGASTFGQPLPPGGVY
jgi:alkylation response protein AidB-like acyl-CoA dehydrogenase